MENYFILFNHTKDGYTIKTIDELINKRNKNMMSWMIYLRMVYHSR